MLNHFQTCIGVYIFDSNPISLNNSIDHADLYFPHLPVGEDLAIESCKSIAERGRWPGAPGGKIKG
jgi:hypothetical protein